MKSVKRLLSVLIVLLTCISLFAGGSAESTAGERTKITVLLNTGGNDETYRTWSQILDKFGEEHGLTIEYELIANKADYMNKLQLYISSDQLPDIYGCFNGPYSDAAKASGQLLNTQKELEELGLFDQYNMAVVDFLKDANDGQMYLMPQALYCEFFFYRTDIFEKYGLTAPTTWQEFLDVCEVLKENGEVPVVVGGKDNWQLTRYLSFIPWRVTHDDFIMDYIALEDTFSNNAAAQAGVELVKTLGTEGYFQRGFTSSDYSDAVNIFFGGTGAIFYGGSGLIANASQMFQDGILDVFPVPAYEGMENMETNIPIHAGVGIAFNAKTYDDVMKELLVYIFENYGQACFDSGVYSPYKGELPEGLDPLFYHVYPLFENAQQSWVSWDDKLDAATMTSMADAEQELALGMLSEADFIAEMDQTIKNNTAN